MWMLLIVCFDGVELLFRRTITFEQGCGHHTREFDEENIETRLDGCVEAKVTSTYKHGNDTRIHAQHVRSRLASDAITVVWGEREYNIM